MKKYKVVQRRAYDWSGSQPIIIEGESEEDAEEKAQNIEDDFEYYDDEFEYEYEIEEVE